MCQYDDYALSNMNVAFANFFKTSFEKHEHIRATTSELCHLQNNLIRVKVKTYILNVTKPLFLSN